MKYSFSYKNLIRKKLPFLTLFLFSASASAVSAQETKDKPAFIEEVVVTAEKRETSLQDTPIAMTAMSGEGLDRAQISNAMDIQMAVPNMTMSKTNFNSSNIAIRGIGNNAVSSAADSGTGVHFNGIYLVGSNIFESEFFDTERVEVLRGPQGTLYGRNTTAGVINVIPKKPSDSFGGDIQVQAGNYNHFKTKGALNIPLTDNLWQRFSIFYTSREGYTESIKPDFGPDNVPVNAYEGDADGRDMYALRSSTLWMLSDATEANLVINYFKEDSNRLATNGGRCNKDPDGILGCLPGKLGHKTPHTGATATGGLNSYLGAQLGVQFPEDDMAHSTNSKNLRVAHLTIEPENRAEETIVSLEIVHDFETYQLTALAGYVDAESNSFGPGSTSVLSELWPVFDANAVLVTPHGNYADNRGLSLQDMNKEREQYSLEVRLASAFGGDVEFLLGAFYLDYELVNNYAVYASSFSLMADINNLDPALAVFDIDENPFQLESSALFGELYYDLDDSLRMTFGLRYTTEEKWNRSRSVFLTFLDDSTQPGGGYEKFNDSWDEVTGKYNITYFTENGMMIYGTLARSYKSGGFNPISSESDLLKADPSLRDFDPEYINSLEVGIKSRFFEERFQANLSYFYYDYKGMQIAKFVDSVALNENVDSVVQGIEAELLFVPDMHWQFGIDAAWLDTEIGGFSTVDPTNPNQKGTTEGVVSGLTGANTTPGLCGVGCQGVPVKIDGNNIPNSPEFSVNLTASYNWVFDTGISLRLATNYYWQDEFYTRHFNEAQDKLDSWEVWNANMILTSADDSWWAEAWIKNILDKDYMTGQFQVDASAGLATNYFLLEPQTYGITLGYRF